MIISRYIAPTALSSLNKGVNFRNTSGYVTDGTNETYSRSYTEGDIFPVSRGGLTFGWEDSGSLGSIDRDSGTDRRFAGICYVINGSGVQRTWRWDITPGIYPVRIALGDIGFAQNANYAEIIDGSSVLQTISGSSGAGQFLDATNVLRTSASDWTSNNQPLQCNISSGILRIKLGHPSSNADASTLAHIFID